MGCLTSARAKNQLALCRGATFVRLDSLPMRRTGALLVARVLVNSLKLHLVVVVIVVTVVIDVVVVVVLVVVVLV